MRDEFLATQVPQSVLQLHQLDEQVVLGIEARGGHRALEIEAEPLLNAQALELSSALGKVEEQDQVEHNRSRQNRVTAQEVDLDLHGIAEPPKDVDIVPTFLVITAWRVIVNAHLVSKVAVKVGVKFGLQNVLEDRKFGFFFGLERAWIFENLAVAIAENVGGEPARQTEHARLEPGRKDGLDQSLPGLEIFAANRGLVLARKLVHGWDVDGEVGGSVGEGHAFFQRGVAVDHRGRDVFVILLQRFFESFHRLVNGAGLNEGLGRAAPDGNEAGGAGSLAELADIVADLLGEIHLGLALFNVGSIDFLDVVVIEDSGARRDLLQERLDLLEEIAVEDTGLGGSVEHVVFEDVPTGEDQVLERSERNEFLDFRRASFGALAQADGAHLGNRANRFRNP